MISVILFLIGLFCVNFVSPEFTALDFADPSLLSRVFHLFTHMLTHANFAHLFGNFQFGFMYLIWAEARLGWRAFLRLYLWCGIAAVSGMAVACAISPDLGGGMIGSSGAIFGIVGWTLADLRVSRWVRAFALSLLGWHLFTQGYLSYEMVTGQTWGYVAFPAHFAGCLFGAACAFWEQVQVSRRRRLS